MTEVLHQQVPSLAPDRLRATCDPQQLRFATTAELADPHTPFGQERALEALQLALETPGHGYNIFVLGRPGSGRHAIVRGRLEAWAAHRAPPQDCCYLHNFDDAQKPRLLSLPPGEGGRLRAAMKTFVGELRKAIEAAFEGEEYRARLQAIHDEEKHREEDALRALADDASAQGVMLLHTPGGFAFAAMRDGHPIPPQEFEAMPEGERKRIEAAMETLEHRLSKWMSDLPRQRREMHNRIRGASRQTMALAAGHLVDELKAAFSEHGAVLSFLDEVLEDVVRSGEEMQERPSEDETDEAVAELSGTLSLGRYQVNVVVDNGATPHAPVLDCDNPTYPNLVGRIDHVAHLGTMLTNFTMIKPGALHRANGGCLMLDAVHVLSHPYSWDGLKRALKSAQVRIDSLPEAMGLGSTPLLEPEPVPLSLKVVLVGERQHYYLLQALDPEFGELFRVAADFEDDVPRDGETTAAFASFVGAIARKRGLRHCDAPAVAQLVEHASRMAGDASRLSTRTQTIEELLHEADTFAARASRTVIAAQDIDFALAARDRRADRMRDLLRDATLRDAVVIDTSGQRPGQANGLAVTQLGEFAFGHPVRITASARAGTGAVVDIERESTLGGPLHSKGVLILSAFVAGRFGRSTPLALSASVVFEQSYGPVEGDSASLAEVCALLSALNGVPLRQSLAITGSIDQFGRVQAIGGVNEKIEGFFDLCRARGLEREHGVIIPAANVQHLMLREDIVEAVRQRRFQVHAVSDVDEALALLSGQPAGTADASGRWAAGTFNALVADRLAHLAGVRQREAALPLLHAQKAARRPRSLPQNGEG